jgi:hypothetical protein
MGLGRDNACIRDVMLDFAVTLRGKIKQLKLAVFAERLIPSGVGNEIIVAY